MTDRLVQLVDGFAGKRIAVIGDLIADEFIYGKLSRVSREAPVLILNYDRTTIVPGGAGNAAANVAALGGDARLVGLIGRSEIDRRLARALPSRVARAGLVRPPDYHTPVKTRILAGGLHSARQQVVRIDRDQQGPIAGETRRSFERSVRQSLAGCDAVLVSDYGSGLITPALFADLKRRLGRSRRRRAVPLLVDSRYNLLRFRGMTACTPNQSEVEQMLGRAIGDDPRRLERAGRTLLTRLRAGGVVLTRGSHGMSVFTPRHRTTHIPIVGTDEVADVTGAGDTVIATIALALTSGASLVEAATLANYAGGLVVMKRGTASVSGSELRGAVLGDGVVRS